MGVGARENGPDGPDARGCGRDLRGSANVGNSYTGQVDSALEKSGVKPVVGALPDFKEGRGDKRSASFLI